MHANAYYPLKVEIYKTKLDEQLLDLLWNKYWVATLSSSLLLSVSFDHRHSSFESNQLTVSEPSIRDQPSARSRIQAGHCRVHSEGVCHPEAQTEHDLVRGSRGGGGWECGPEQASREG